MTVVGTPTTCTAGNGDCMDFVVKCAANAYPGQNAYFTEACGSGTLLAKTSFDYDCSGTIDKHYPSLASGCQKQALPGGTFACLGSGWASSVPACGASGSFKLCAKSGTSCVLSTVNRTQDCR